MSPEKMPGFDTSNMPSSDELEAQKNMEELMRMGEEAAAEGLGARKADEDIVKRSNKEKNFISREDLPVNIQTAIEIAENQILEDINIRSDEQRDEIRKELNLRWFSNYQFMNGKLMEWGGKNIKSQDLGNNFYESIREDAESMLKKKIKNIEFKEN